MFTQFLVDPQDRRPIEYLDDEKLISLLTGDPEEINRTLKRGTKSRHPKEDKPLVKLVPFIEAIRARRYTHIQELLVWDCHVQYDDMLSVVCTESPMNTDCDTASLIQAGLVSRNCYVLQRLELIDCLLDPKTIATLVTALSMSKTLKELCLDFNE